MNKTKKNEGKIKSPEIQQLKEIKEESIKPNAIHQKS